MIVIQIMFLAYSLYVAEKYLLTQTTSKEHRLMPVILVISTLYNFYQVVECVSKDSDVFFLLEDLLIIQVIFAVIHYKKDFLHLHFPAVAEMCLFFSLLVIDIYLVWDYQLGRRYRYLFWVSIGAYVLIIFGINMYIHLRMHLNKRENKVGHILFFSFSLVGLTLPTRLLPYPYKEIIVPLSIAIAETMISYLLKTGIIIDTAHLMQQQMYDTSKIATILLDDDFTYLSSNEVAQEIFGEEIQRVRDSKSKEAFQQQLEKTLSKYNMEQEIVYKGRYYRQQIIPEYYLNSLRGYIIYMIDITRQKQEIQLMEGLKQDAESAAEMKSRFLARMSHDLRSPLHAILGFSDILLRDRSIAEKNQSMLMHIKNAGTTLLSLVNAILDFSKLESGKMELDDKPYSVEKMLGDLTYEGTVVLQDKDVELSTQIVSRYPEILIGDEIRVREIIQNLLSNAIKYTMKGIINCSVQCEYEKAKERVKITCIVSDTGIGMTKEQIENAFEEYMTYVGERKLESTGLGLPIVKQLTNMMGGEVSAESDGVSGTTFYATFYQGVTEQIWKEPITFTKERLLTQTNEAVQVMKPNWIYPKAQVLVADDMKVNFEIFKNYTEPWKFHIDVVENGIEAVEAARKKEYQLIFMDKMMPKMDGIEAATNIRKFSKVPIVLLTADISEETQNMGKMSGITAFMEKPLQFAQLQEVIEKYIDSKYRQAEREEYISKHVDNIAVVKAFVKEAERLRLEIPMDWEKGELEDFRIKVHGIKGAGRNIAEEELSRQAEILEMAAKVENKIFIDENLQSFLELLDKTIERLKTDVEEGERQENKENVSIISSEEEQMSNREFLVKIKEGFDAFDLIKIEENLQLLEQKQLSAEEQVLIQGIRNAFEELEYEEGCHLVETYLQGI